MRKGRRTGTRRKYRAKLMGFTRREERRADAENRAEYREQRGWTGQLAELDRRLGPGVGAKRERDRLELERRMAGAKVVIDRARSRLDPNTGILHLRVNGVAAGVVEHVAIGGRWAIP